MSTEITNWGRGSTHSNDTNPLMAIPSWPESLQGNCRVIPKTRQKFSLSNVPKAADKDFAARDRADPEPRYLP